MKKITLILILISGLLFSQKSFNISGNISGFSDNAIVRITKDNLAIDSCKLNNGNFILKGELQNAPSGVYLEVKDEKNFKYAFLFIGNENISINTVIA